MEYFQKDIIDIDYKGKEGVIEIFNRGGKIVNYFEGEENNPICPLIESKIKGVMIGEGAYGEVFLDKNKKYVVKQQNVDPDIFNEVYKTTCSFININERLSYDNILIDKIRIKDVDKFTSYFREFLENEEVNRITCFIDIIGEESSLNTCSLYEGLLIFEKKDENKIDIYIFDPLGKNSLVDYENENNRNKILEVLSQNIFDDKYILNLINPDDWLPHNFIYFENYEDKIKYSKFYNPENILTLFTLFFLRIFIANGDTPIMRIPHTIIQSIKTIIGSGDIKSYLLYKWLKAYR